MRPLGTWAWQGCAVAGGVATVVLTRGIGFKAWVVLAAAFAVYAALLLIVPRARDKDEVDIGSGDTLASVEGAIGAAASAIASIRENAKRLSERRREDALLASNVANAILDEIRREPRRLKDARQFFESHLPRLDALVGEYARLYSLPKGVRDEASIAVAHDALKASVAGFQSQFKALVERDQQALSVSAESLTRMLTAEHGHDVRRAVAPRQEG